MVRRRPGAALRGVALSALVAALVTGCSEAPTVRVDAADLSDADRAACRDLLDAVPDTLGDRDRRPVEPADAVGAAWGSDPIVLTCGVAVPDLEPTAVCQEADGVGWYVGEQPLEDDSVDVVMTTAGYRPVVEVVVPAGERPEGVAAAMAGLAPAVAEHTELVRRCL